MEIINSFGRGPGATEEDMSAFRRLVDGTHGGRRIVVSLDGTIIYGYAKTRVQAAVLVRKSEAPYILRDRAEVMAKIVPAIYRRRNPGYDEMADFAAWGVS